MKKSHKIAIAGLLAVGGGFVSWQVAGPQAAGRAKEQQQVW